MSGICGWVGGARAALDEMGAPLAAWDSAEALRIEGADGAVAGASLHGNASVYQHAGLLVAVVGQPYIRGREDAPFAETFTEAFLEEGRAVLSRLAGRFAIAVVREDGSEALLVADRCGCHPLYYAAHEGAGLVFGTSPLALAAHPAVSAEINSQAIFDYFFFHQVPAPHSIRRGQRRLLPGEFVHFRNGAIELGFWGRTTYRGRAAPLDVLRKEFRELLRKAVERTVAPSVGCFLSGGTDSSTIVGILTEVLGGPVRTYSIGFAAEGYDEMEYARTAASRFASDHREYYVTPDDVVEAIPAIAAIHGNPFANESAVPTYFCARLAAREGVTRMLAGDGGDEIFGGNERYTSQRVFEHWGRLPGFLRTLVAGGAKWFPFGQSVPLVRKARRYIEQAETRMPDRFYSHTLLRSLGHERVFEPAFLASVDPEEPLRLGREVYHGADADCSLNRMLALDLKFTLADNDLPKVNRSCELAGIQVAYPLLDDDLCDFGARLPAELKVKGRELRWFFKWALDDLLPEKIIKKQKHGFGLPFGVWLRDHAPLQELARASLAGLRGRGIVRPAFVDEIFELHRTGHAGYYGVMIWTLMMLEQWFQVHGEPARQARPSPSR